MSRNTGTFNFAANFEGLLKAPIDAKQLVGTYADLTTPATWNGSGSVWLYNGAMVVVGSDSTPENNGIYWLCDANNYTMTCAWKKAGSGSGTGTLTGVTNGLHLTGVSGATVALGGLLTQPTIFSGSSTNHLKYFNDYSAGFTTYSLIDKNYADNIVSGLRPKAAVKVATIGNLTYPFSGLTSIDSQSISNGDRVLVKDQTLSGQTNGVWVASASTWTRATDFDGSPFGEVVSGSYMWVLSGNTNANTSWVLDTPDPIYIHNITGTSLNFVLFSHVQDVTAGTGITVNTITGTHQISINPTNQAILAATITGGTNGLGYTNRNVCLGGTLLNNTNIDGNYTLTFSGGSKLNTTCGYQISGTTIFDTSRKSLSNINIGCQAGNSTGTGNNNTAIGYQTLYLNTTGRDNVAIGREVLNKNIRGNENIGIGGCVLCSNICGNSNVAIGHQALSRNISGCSNIALGYQALCNNTKGCWNIANGYGALSKNTIGNFNIANGFSALFSNTNGSLNIAIGSQALSGKISGDCNLGIGDSAGYSNVSGSSNIFIGNSAGGINITGSSNIFIGTCAGYNETTSNKLYIANSDTVNPLIKGNFATSAVTLNAKLTLGAVPTAGALTDVVLVRNTGGEVRTISVSSITGATAYNFTNGLTKQGSIVKLGGNLTGSTIINLCDNSLRFQSDSTSIGLANFNLNSIYANSKFGICSCASGGSGAQWGLSGNSASISTYHCSDSSNGSSIAICNSGITLTNKCSSALKTVNLTCNALMYGNDYCSVYTDRTLVDRGYVSSVSNVLNVCIVGTTYTTLRNDDLIGVSGLSSNLIYLYSSPVLGQRVSVVDVCGCALIDPITIHGNGKPINDGVCATINTDYGSVTFVYNGIFWSAIAFVN